ncbi:hypothetical protein NESM_000854200 [Novymonas esmeraldas]|uniref:Uncharacterized protein n=1 Tax=Novymonas esmeraldas TaxID=1808958 RepID=A0AAW0EZD0_9TRYP
MATIPDCDPYVGQQEYPITSYGKLCMEPAVDQNKMWYDMPTVRSWSRSFWYVWFIIGLIIAFCIIGCIFQSLRWYRRIKHRHERESRSKRVDGLLRVVSSMYRKKSDLMAQTQSQAQSQAPSQTQSRTGTKGRRPASRTPSRTGSRAMSRSQSFNVRDGSDDDDHWGR